MPTLSLANGITALPNSSSTWSFRPAISEILLEGFDRVQIPPAALEDPNYVISGRRSLNLICLDISANRGVNLWKVGDEDNTLSIPLVPGQASYNLPTNVVYILDTYLRQYTPNTIYQALGNMLTPMTTGGGEPMTQATGEPMIMSPGAGVFSTTQGSTLAQMYWPNHGLMIGSPVIFEMPVTLGPMTIGGPYGFCVVDSVIDQNNIMITLPVPAPATRTGVGGTPLFWTFAGSPIVNVILPGLGLGYATGAQQPLIVGQPFVVQMPTAVGGLTLSGSYPIVGITTPTLAGIAPSQFQILASAPATSGAAAFENGGFILATSQAPGVQVTDTLLWPVSRNDYAAFPNKFSPGRPSVYWFNRAIQPTLHIWSTAATNSFWSIQAYRMVEIEDADPLMGQNPDLPRRFYPALCAELAAALAEKFKPEAHATKLVLAAAAWDRAANADREMVSLYVVPQMQSYYR